MFVSFAVWKTPDEFFHYFPDVPRKMDLSHAEFEEKVRKALEKNMDPDDIIILDVTYNQSLMIYIRLPMQNTVSMTLCRRL